MSRLLGNPFFHLAVRLGIGGYFLYACVDKLLDPAGFARIVYQWQAAGPEISNLVAVVLPWIELVAGLLLVLGVWRREAAAVLGLRLVVFSVAAVFVLARGIDVTNCGCTSVAVTATHAWWEGVGWFLLTRNTLMLAAMALVVLVVPRPLSFSGLAPASGGRSEGQDLDALGR